jgi:hypothetical protein
MVSVIFRCPNTGLQVQGWIDDDPDRPIAYGGATFEAVACSVCTRTHMVNPKTGKVLGEDE